MKVRTAHHVTRSPTPRTAIVGTAQVNGGRSFRSQVRCNLLLAKDPEIGRVAPLCQAQGAPLESYVACGTAWMSAPDIPNI